MDSAASEGPVSPRAFRVACEGDGGVIVLSGEFDNSSRLALLAALYGAITNTSGALVDVRAVTFLDASTVGVFVMASQAATRAGGQVRLVGASGIVERVLRLCGVWHSLTAAQPSAGVRAGWDASQEDSAGIFPVGRSRGAGSAELLDATDRLVVLDAIISAATDVGAADACDLQIYEESTQSLRMAWHRGFTDEFLSYFASVDATQPTACATALATGLPVLIDDITRSPIFDPATLKVILASGTRAVQSYPLHDDRGATLGVLSFHYHTLRPRQGRPDLVARQAAQALTRLAAG